MANIAKVNEFKSLVNTKDMVKRMATTCGGKEAAGQFMASMLDLYEGDNYLQNCDAQKVLMECLKAASLKLPLVKSLGYAYVVPYKSTPTFIIGYKGLVQLALRSGQYTALNADCLYEGEEVSFNRLTGQMSIIGQATSNKAVGYFAYFKLVNGFEKAMYMTTEQVQEYARKYSKAYNSGPWQTQFDSMAKKTILRQLLKFGPMSTDMQTAENMEVSSAQERSQASINANANRVPIDMNPPIVVDEATGEVLPAGDPQAIAPPPASSDVMDAQMVMGEAFPADPGF